MAGDLWVVMSIESAGDMRSGRARLRQSCGIQLGEVAEQAAAAVGPPVHRIGEDEMEKGT